MATHAIRARGELDRRWSVWFETLTITSGGHGIAVQSGETADQAALHGTLNKIRDLNLLLISVTCLELDHWSAWLPTS